MTFKMVAYFFASPPRSGIPARLAGHRNARRLRVAETGPVPDGVEYHQLFSLAERASRRAEVTGKKFQFAPHPPAVGNHFSAQ